VATVSRIDSIIGLLSRRDLSKRRYYAKETYDFLRSLLKPPIIDKRETFKR